jgi:rhamnosyltransferase
LKLSIIIPTYQAEPYLERLLTTLSAQTVAFELIVIDSSSTDKTRQIAACYTDRVLTIPKASFDHGGTRTLAAQTASGEIVVFLTQDALPCSVSTIEALIEAFDDPQVGAAYGRQLPHEGTSLFGSHLRYFNYPSDSYVRRYTDKDRYGIKTVFLSDSFAAYRKSTLEEIGWLKNGLIVGEDSYAGAKILQSGYALAYVAKAQTYHAHSYTLLQEFRRYFDVGVFHREESWILDTFGKAEGEGRRYLKSELRYLMMQKAYGYLPEFLVRNALKYLGYKLGQHHHRLPGTMIESMSMHKGWWQKRLSTENN